MSAPDRPIAPKVFAGSLRRSVRKAIAFHEKYPEYDQGPQQAVEFQLQRLNEGVHDFDGSTRTARQSRRLVKRAVETYLHNSIKWCQRHPEFTDTTAQLRRVLAAVESDRFEPRDQSAYKASQGARNPQVTQGGLDALNTPQNGAQGRTEAYAGLIVTEEYEPW